MKDTIEKLNKKMQYTKKEILDILEAYGFSKVAFTVKDNKTTHAVIELSVQVKG